MTHGITFHYFWNENIPNTQGAIDGNQFRQIIDACSKNNNILCAEEYYNKAVSRQLKENDICLTFDDGLSSQYLVAEPILKEKGLTAFFFVYTSPMEGVLEKIEVYRAFRNSYSDIEEFYRDFFSVLFEFGDSIGIEYFKLLNTKEAKEYYKNYKYYSDNDRLFRYARNVLLQEKYDLVMMEMMRSRRFNVSDACRELWISSDQIKVMRGRGHVIGLHSHTHPTTLSEFSYAKKTYEYSTNKMFLEEIIGEVKTASYPCDSYDEDSRSVLVELGIEVAFLARMKELDDDDIMRIARMDASFYLR